MRFEAMNSKMEMFRPAQLDDDLDSIDATYELLKAIKIDDLTGTDALPTQQIMMRVVQVTLHHPNLLTCSSFSKNKIPKPHYYSSSVSKVAEPITKDYKVNITI